MVPCCSLCCSVAIKAMDTTNTLSLCYLICSKLLTALTFFLHQTISNSTCYRCSHVLQAPAANRRLVKYHKVEWWLSHTLRCLFKAAVMCFILFSSDSVSFYCKKSISRKVPSSPFHVLVMSKFSWPETSKLSP